VSLNSLEQVDLDSLEQVDLNIERLNSLGHVDLVAKCFDYIVKIN